MKTTLCYIEHRNCLLMLLRNKKKADISEGKWIGVGGKFLDGESADECLVREVREETGYELADWTFRGLVEFVNDQCENEDMHLYTARLLITPDTACDAAGMPVLPECAEGELAWIDKRRVTELNIWEGDRYFLEKLLEDDICDASMRLVYHGDSLIRVECPEPPQSGAAPEHP